ncbi:MAG TPA: M67 family metallopeptidase [Acidimicrobiia bacterium]|jgi:proteasome lid subunit RPN8/RPN11|nr:M67 family metallopeptidase [Acidimicrobiia bacterium]
MRPTQATLRLTESQYATIIGNVYDGLPNEACGLLIGPWGSDGHPTGVISKAWPCRNAAESAVVYTVDGRDYLAASRAAEALGHEIVGVWHSHTHTEAYPSPTDVRQAADPDWWYPIVSLRDGEPTLRAYRIADGDVTESPVELARD